MMHSGLSLFFQKNLVLVFFFYGFSFVFLAAAILFSFRALRAIGLANVFLYLLSFSLLHGVVEWIDMYQQYRLHVLHLGVGESVQHFRFYLLALSFVLLFLFGLSMNLREPTRTGGAGVAGRGLGIGIGIGIATLVLALAVAQGGVASADLTELESGVRYLLAFPAAVLAGTASYRLSRQEYKSILPKHYGRYFRISAVGFLLYGVFAGLVAPKSGTLVAPFFNQDTFFAQTGVPVQILRAVCALLISYAFVSALALKITFRLMNTFIVFFAMLGILGLAGYINLRLVTDSYRDIVKLEKEEKDFSYLYKSFNRMHGLLRSPIIGAQDGKYLPLLKEYTADFEREYDSLKALAHEDRDEEEMIQRIATLYRQAIRQKAGSVSISAGELERLKALVGEINDIHSKEVADHKEDVLRNAENFSEVIFSVLLVSFMILIFSWSGVYRRMVLPAEQLRKGAHQIAEGNLQHRIAINTADEFQELANDFNAMGEKLLERTLKHQEAARKLEELSVKDELTSLYNRRYFNSKWEEELNRARRNNTELALLLLDMDDFKKYNDTHGHQAGDGLLRSVGAFLHDHLRRTDFACRYGGEEFAVIMPDAGKERAALVAEKLRSAIQDHVFPGEKTQPLGDVTITIGISSYPADSTELADLIKKADDALYEAKNRGKNRVYVYGT